MHIAHLASHRKHFKIFSYRETLRQIIMFHDCVSISAGYLAALWRIAYTMTSLYCYVYNDACGRQEAADFMWP